MSDQVTATYHALNHPLVKYWLTILRDVNTQAPLFRAACTELSAILAYEALRVLPVSERTIRTPLEITTGYEIATNVCVVPILRTGLLMMDGVCRIFPSAKILPIGLRRMDDGTLLEYDVDLFASDEELYCLIVDGIVGTGTTFMRAIQLCTKYWPNAVIRAVCFIGLESGFDRISHSYPNVNIFTADCDREENDLGYMLPGIGDMRRRAYQTDSI